MCVLVCVYVRYTAVSLHLSSTHEGFDKVFAHVTTDVISTRAREPRGGTSARLLSLSISFTYGLIYITQWLNFFLKARSTEKLIPICPRPPCSFLLLF